VAFLVAPLAPGFLFLFLALFRNPSEGVWGLKLSAMVTYPAMTVLGVPMHLLLVKRGWTSGWVYTLVGLVIGTIMGGVLFGRNVAILGAILGAATSFVFWVIARPHTDPGTPPLDGLGG
jgi:hypothetical protein